MLRGKGPGRPFLTRKTGRREAQCFGQFTAAFAVQAMTDGTAFGKQGTASPFGGKNAGVFAEARLRRQDGYNSRSQKGDQFQDRALSVLLSQDRRFGLQGINFSNNGGALAVERWRQAQKLFALSAPRV